MTYSTNIINKYKEVKENRAIREDSPAKIFRTQELSIQKAQEFKDRGSLLPSGGEADVRVAVVAPAEVDDEAIRIEDADDDTVTPRHDREVIGAPHVDVGEEPLSRC